MPESSSVEASAGEESGPGITGMSALRNLFALPIQLRTPLASP